MSETKPTVVIPKATVRKLKNISKKLKKLNIGGDQDIFWIALGDDSYDAYSWSQFEIGLTRDSKIVTCYQSGCSCNGPEQPTPDKTFELGTTDLEIDKDDYREDSELAVKDLIPTVDTLYKVLNDKDATPKEIIALPNAEVRRAVVEIVGYEKIVEDAETLDDSETDGILLRIPLQGDEDIVLVHVKDPSTDREYFLRVPPEMKTARQARAWTFGFEPDEFVLTKES